MSKINMSTEVAIGADELWKLIGGFNALPNWHPAIEKSELDESGKIRTLSITGGVTIKEELIEADDDERTYSYSIQHGALPVSNYKATIKVRQNEDGSTSTLDWSSEFEPVGSETDAVQTIQGIYQAGFDNLRKMFGG